MADYVSSRLIAADNIDLSLSSDIHEITLSYLPDSVTKTLLQELASKTSIEEYDLCLHFEKITGKGVPPVIEVYLNLAEGEKPKQDNYAGALGLYGIETSSTAGLEHDDSGQHRILEVSQLLSQLSKNPNWSDKGLKITLTLGTTLPVGSVIEIGRVSLYLHKKANQG